MPWYEPLLNALLGALVGASVGAYFSLRHLRTERRLSFRERQLSEFYAPMAGLRRQILAKSELRARVSSASNAAWQEAVASSPRPMPNHDEEFAPYKRIIDYENSQLRDELMPMYREMLKLFTQQYHLAAPETRGFYQGFVDFVEIWNRWLADALPADVWKKLDHNEERVKPFYDHVEAKLQELQDELVRG